MKENIEFTSNFLVIEENNNSNNCITDCNSSNINNCTNNSSNKSEKNSTDDSENKSENDSENKSENDLVNNNIDNTNSSNTNIKDENMIIFDKYISNIKSELLFDIFFNINENKDAIHLLYKIKENLIEQILEKEIICFKKYLKELILLIKSKFGIESDFVATIYIMFYSKDHLFFNKKNYYWYGSKLIIDIANFEKIIKFYYDVKIETLITYFRFCGFQTTKYLKGTKGYVHENFSNTQLNLNELDDNFQSRMGKNNEKKFFENLEKKVIGTLNILSSPTNVNNSSSPINVNNSSQNLNQNLESNDIDVLLNSAINLVKNSNNMDEISSLIEIKKIIDNKIAMCIAERMVSSSSNQSEESPNKKYKISK